MGMKIQGIIKSKVKVAYINILIKNIIVQTNKIDLNIFMI